MRDPTSRAVVFGWINSSSFGRSGAVLSRNDGISYNQHVHLCPQEAIQCFLSLADHGFVLVERCVEHHWYACEGAKALNEPVISWIGKGRHRLQTTPSNRLAPARGARKHLVQSFPSHRCNEVRILLRPDGRRSNRPRLGRIAEHAVRNHPNWPDDIA